MHASPDQPEQKIFSDHFDTLRDALELLYIKSNLSGRNQFAKQWPLPAAYIFGEELARSDREGSSDRSRRSVLESEAEHRRLYLLELSETLPTKSVDKGVLQTEFVRGVITELGWGLALCFYAERIVKKFSDQQVPPVIEEAPVIIPEPALEISPIVVDEPKADEQKAIETPPAAPLPKLNRPYTFAELAAMSEDDIQKLNIDDC